jgi:hypothetical protein
MDNAEHPNVPPVTIANAKKKPPSIHLDIRGSMSSIEWGLPELVVSTGRTLTVPRLVMLPAAERHCAMQIKIMARYQVRPPAAHWRRRKNCIKG